MKTSLCLADCSFVRLLRNLTMLIVGKRVYRYFFLHNHAHLLCPKLQILTFG